MKDGIYREVKEKDLTNEDIQITTLYSMYMLGERMLPREDFLKMSPIEVVLSIVESILMSFHSDLPKWEKEVAHIVEICKATQEQDISEIESFLSNFGGDGDSETKH